jgi:HTH-type transcriptional regulator / antitoxin HigA
MDENSFLDEFYKILTPEDAWEGEKNSISIKEIFDAKLNQYNITQNQAEKLLKMEKRTLEGILNNSLKRVDVINLLKIGQFLGLNTDALMKIFIKDQSKDIIQELEDAKKKSFIISNFDLKNLCKSGFISTKSDLKLVEDRINKFFGFNNIFEYRKKNYIPAFSKTKKTPSILMREFWVISALTFFEKIENPNTYNRELFVELIPKIRPYTKNVENGLKIVAQALYNVGVTVIYQPHTTTTQVRGATFNVNGKPCIVITDLNKNYATIWFALMHEIYHVLYDFEEISKQVYHLTGEVDLFLLQEDKADEFSREYLCSEKNTEYIIPFIDSPHIVEEYAKECQVHPSIIYNFYCWDMETKRGENYWGKFKQHKVDVKIALRDLNINLLKKESIEETVKYLKEKIFNF